VPTVPYVSPGEKGKSADQNLLIDKVQIAHYGWDYIVWYDGATVIATNGRTKSTDYSGSNWVTIVNSIISAATIDVLIFVRPDVPASTSTLTLNKSGVTVYCPKTNLKQGASPFAEKVVLGGNSSAQVRRVTLWGIQMDELEIGAPSSSFDVDGWTVAFCQMNSYTTAGRQGLRFTGPGDIENGLFLDCQIRAQQNNVNCITWEATSDANGHIAFYRCHLDNVGGLTGVDSIEYSATGPGHSGVAVTFTDCSFVHIGGLGPTGCSILRLSGSTIDAGPRYLVMTNCHYEVQQANMDLFQIASASAFVYFSVVLQNPSLTVGAFTYQWIVNNNVGQMHKGSGLQIRGGHLTGTDPTSFTRGTTNESNNFVVKIEDVQRFNPPVAQQAYDFICFTVGSTTWAISGDGATAFSGATAATVIQSAIDALPAYGGIILIHASISSSTGNLTIAKNNVCLVGLGTPNPSGSNEQPLLQKILLDGSSVSIDGGRLEGIQVRMIDINATTGVISDFQAKDVSLRIDGTTDREGIVFRGTNNIRHMNFHNIHARVTAASKIAIDFRNTSTGTGDINFTGTTYIDNESASTGTVAVQISADARCSFPISFENLVCHDIATSGGMKPIYMVAHTVSDRGFHSLYIARFFFLQAVASLTHTLITIDSSSAASRFICTIANLVVSEQATGTVNLISNSNTNWQTRPQSLNILSGARLGSGTIAIGTMNLHTWFRVNLGRDISGWTPTNQITNPFKTAASQNFIAPGGSASGPTASTVYVIGVSDVFITSSGGTSVSITIADAAGNAIESGLGTLTNKYVPRGYSVNFGAFSVAPTVTVWGT